MAKLSSLVNLSTVTKVAGGVVAGGLSAVAVQRYTSSSEEPAKTEMREEQQQKKLKFEVEQRSNELNQKEQSLKALEEALARREAALKEERSAVQQMQQTAAAAVAAESAATVAVETVGMSEEIPSESEAQKQEAVTPTPADNTPKRPAVFDGGNKEPAAPVDDKKKPSVAFGSSGDVVTIEKGGADSDAETDRLRKEVERLRQRLNEQKEQLLLAKRQHEFGEADSDKDDAFAESDAFGSDPSDDKGKAFAGSATRTLRKRATAGRSNPADFKISRFAYNSANSGTSTTTTTVPSTTTTVPSVPVGREEVDIVKKLFEDGSLDRNSYFLSKGDIDDLEKNADNPKEIAPAILKRDKSELNDQHGHIEAFARAFPLLGQVKSVGVLVDLARKMAYNIGNLSSDAPDAIKPLSREEVFTALQSSVEQSVDNFLLSKDEQPLPTDPELEVKCQQKKQAYRAMVHGDTVVTTANAKDFLEKVKRESEAKYKKSFDGEGYFGNKKAVLQKWFDLRSSLKGFDLDKTLRDDSAGAPPPVPAAPLMMINGKPLDPRVLDEDINWVEGRGAPILPSKKTSKDVPMGAFSGSASSFGIKIVKYLRENVEVFKKTDDDFSEQMKNLWDDTEPGDTKNDKKFEQVYKKRNRFWGSYINGSRYDLLGLQYCACVLPKVLTDDLSKQVVKESTEEEEEGEGKEKEKKTEEKEKEETKKISVLDLPAYEGMYKSVSQIFRHFGNTDPNDEFGEKRLRSTGVMVDGNADKIKKAYALAKEFKSVVSKLESMRTDYKKVKDAYDIGTGASLNEEGACYDIVIPKLEHLDSDDLYKALARDVGKIRSLEISSVGADSCVLAFQRFLKLCSAMERLESLKICAPWGSYMETNSIFYSKDSRNSVRGSTLSRPDDPEKPLTNEEQFLAAISVIPNLKEIHILKDAKTKNFSVEAKSLDDWIMTVKDCEIVELPIVVNLSAILDRFSQLDNIATKKRRIVLNGSGKSVLSDFVSKSKNIACIVNLLKNGKGNVSIGFNGTVFDKENPRNVQVRPELCTFYTMKNSRAERLEMPWMDSEVDDWMEFHASKQKELGREDCEAWLLKNEITLDTLKDKLGIFLELFSITTVDWANQVSYMFLGKGENSKYSSAFSLAYRTSTNTAEEDAEQLKAADDAKIAKSVLDKEKERLEEWKRTHAVSSDFWNALKKLPAFTPGRGCDIKLEDDECRNHPMYYYLSPLLAAALLHTDRDEKNYYFFQTKDGTASAHCNLIFPGIADGPLFKRYRTTGKLLGNDKMQMYSKAFAYGKLFNGEPCFTYSQDVAREFSEKYDRIELKKTDINDILNFYLSADCNRTPKIIQMLSQLKVQPGVIIRHRKFREDGQPTDNLLMEIIYCVNSGYQNVIKMKPLEEELKKKEAELLKFKVDEKIGKVFSEDEKSQRKELEKDIADLHGELDPLADDLKFFLKYLEVRKKYTDGLKASLRVYKASQDFCRVEPDGSVRVITKPVAKSTVAAGATATRSRGNSVSKRGGGAMNGTATSAFGVATAFRNAGNTGNPTRPRNNSISRINNNKGKKKNGTNAPVAPKVSVGALVNRFNNMRGIPNPTTTTAPRKTYQANVDKWVRSGRKVMYYRNNGTLSDVLLPTQTVASLIKLSDPDPKKARLLKQGEAPNPAAVERLIFEGSIFPVEKVDATTGKRTGVFYVRFRVN